MSLSDIIPKEVINLIEPFDFKSVYELGNKKTAGRPYSEFYEQEGIEYTSIDLNGLDGALMLDLAKPIDLPSRDIVSNIGTSEHIMDQSSVFKNIHNLSHDRMVHWVPLAEKHPSHGYWGYELEFFEQVSRINSYEIEKLYIERSYKDWSLVCCSLRKTDNKQPFVWDDNLPLIYNEGGHGGIEYR